MAPTVIYLMALLVLAVLWFVFPHSAKHPERHPLQRAVQAHRR